MGSFSARRLDVIPLEWTLLSEMLEAFRAGEGVELIRDGVQLVLPESIEVEATQQIGGARDEASDTPSLSATGPRPRC